MQSWNVTIGNGVEKSFDEDLYDIKITSLCLKDPESCKEPVIVKCHIDGGVYNIGVLTKDRPSVNVSALLSSDDEVVLSSTGIAKVNVIGVSIPIYDSDEDDDYQESFDDIDSDELEGIFNASGLSDDDSDEVPILFDHDDNIVETSGPIIEEIPSEDDITPTKASDNVSSGKNKKKKRKREKEHTNGNKKQKQT